jgi:ABC-type antimicrobial peptide transport system permease subunit
MFKNYLLTAFRSFLRQGTYSFINLAGLAIGLTCTIFIFLWVLDEISYDDFHADKDRIFQVMENQTYSADQIYTFKATPGLLSDALQQEFAEIEFASRSSWNNRLLFRYEDKSIYEEGLYADSSLFDIFTFPILAGDRKNLLPDNNSIAISERTSRKYFGDDDAIGKMFRINGEFDVKVTAVFNDIPENSSIRLDFVIPFDRLMKQKGNEWMSNWGSNGIQTFVKLHRADAMGAVNEKIKEFIKKRNEGSVVDLFLFPMKDWRLRSNFEKGNQSGGRIAYVWAFEIVAIFILLIACINFMNLATARAMNRSREVGVRKAVGAQRWSLIVQFMAESIAITFMSLGVALILVHLLMPMFNDLTSKHISMDYTQPVIVIGLITSLVVTGLVAGSYPAIFLSSFRPAAVLKGNTSQIFGGSALRKALVVFQFTLSVALIACALVVYRQISYIQTKNLGFDKENQLFFSRREGIRKSFAAFREEALRNPVIKAVAQASALPMEVGSSTGAEWKGKTEDDKVLFPVIQIDHDYLALAEFKFVDGRNFSRDVIADSVNYVITEDAARRMRMDNPVGEELTVWDRPGRVIGVVKDFHSSSLYSNIEPVIFMLIPEYSGNIFVRYEPGKGVEAVKIMEGIHKKFEPEFPFEPEFLDDAFNQQYKSEAMIGKLSTVFTVMAIFISCLGLFGLASYTTERRTKEIGIRKVMGATVSNLVLMLCRDFVLLVVLSIAVGCPVAWYVMQKFLDQYQFHTDLSLWIFVITAVSILLIAILTVAYRSLTASIKNPATALRTE